MPQHQGYLQQRVACKCIFSHELFYTCTSVRLGTLAAYCCSAFEPTDLHLQAGVYLAASTATVRSKCCAPVELLSVKVIAGVLVLDYLSISRSGV